MNRLARLIPFVSLIAWVLILALGCHKDLPITVPLTADQQLAESLVGTWKSVVDEAHPILSIARYTGDGHFVDSLFMRSAYDSTRWVSYQTTAGDFSLDQSFLTFFNYAFASTTPVFNGFEWRNGCWVTIDRNRLVLQGGDVFSPALTGNTGLIGSWSEDVWMHAETLAPVAIDKSGWFRLTYAFDADSSTLIWSIHDLGTNPVLNDVQFRDNYSFAPPLLTISGFWQNLVEFRNGRMNWYLLSSPQQFDRFN